MTKIEIADDMMQVDAKVLAKALRMDTNDLKQGMRDGTITGRIERGEGKDAGKVRLTFFSADRRVRMTADENGNLLTCGAVDFTRRAMPVSRMGGGTTEVETAYRAQLDALLDNALRDTFPASDPVAISFDSPGRTVVESGKRHDR